MRTIVETAGAAGGPLALALLSGTYSEPEDFIREGFPAAVRDQGVDAEIIMADVRAAWFADGSVVRRLRESVVAPAMARGRTRIWLVGVSLGGLAALCYAARFENEIAGIVLISPYPATRDVLREMSAAGGVRSWNPRIPPQGDLEREAWRWLAGPCQVPVHCYFASDDRFADGQRLMAQAIDPQRVRELPGSHDWESWRRLWGEFLCVSKTSLH